MTTTTARTPTATHAETAKPARMRTRPSGRPMLYTAYGQEMALFNTATKRVMVGPPTV